MKSGTIRLASMNLAALLSWSPPAWSGQETAVSSQGDLATATARVPPGVEYHQEQRTSLISSSFHPFILIHQPFLSLYISLQYCNLSPDIHALVHLIHLSFISAQSHLIYLLHYFLIQYLCFYTPLILLSCSYHLLFILFLSHHSILM